MDRKANRRSDGPSHRLPRKDAPVKEFSGIRQIISAKVVKVAASKLPTNSSPNRTMSTGCVAAFPSAGHVLVATTEVPLRKRSPSLAAERVALARRLICLRGKPGIVDNDFLKFLMQSDAVQEQLHSRATGTTVLGIKQSEFRKVALPLSPIGEQHAIAHILGTLDDKIELNRRMNETLEAMARALFKSWFVDFDPVRAKAEGRDPGLPKPLADLFPDSFEDSELGEIPKGWRVASLPDVFEVNPTRPLRKGDIAAIPRHGQHAHPGYTHVAVMGHSARECDS